MMTTEECTCGDKYASSRHIIYNPSPVAQKTLLHIKEIGEVTAVRQVTTRFYPLKAYLYMRVVKGSGYLILNHQHYTLAEGDCVFVNCNELRGHLSNENQLRAEDDGGEKEAFTLQWIIFQGPCGNAVYTKYLDIGGTIQFHPKNNYMFAAAWQNIYSAATSAGFMQDMKINGTLNNLLILLLDEFWRKQEEEQENAEGKRRNIMPIKRYLDEHYAEKLSLDELANSFYIGKTYMNRIFKQKYGVSISTYLLHVRINHAKHMLRFTDKKVETIGLECGLGELPYFSRTFKKVEGIPPSAYRERSEGSIQMEQE